MAKYERVLDCFPAFYTAAERRGLLLEVVRALVAPLEEADTHLFRIQRAHRVRVAEHAEDLIRLAAALDLARFHFADVLDLESEALDYETRLAVMRERIERVARLSLRGLGTPWAVLEGTAIFLDAAIVATRPGDPLVAHLDGEHFSHRATIEFPRAARAPRRHLYLHENPQRRRTVEVTERYPLDSWVVENRNVTAAPTRLVIEAVGDRTVLPMIFCPATAEAIQFNGIVPAGASLVIDAADGATIGGYAVDRWIAYSKGGSFDFSEWDRATVVVEERDDVTPFDSGVGRIELRPFQRRKPVPSAPVGRSEWHFTVAEGVSDRSALDYAVFATPREPIGEYDGSPAFDACVFDFPASGLAGMAWSERIPCAFKLLVPPRTPSLGDSNVDGDGDAWRAPDLGRLTAILTRFKPAGIRAYVDVGRDAWILGESVIRSAAATDGPGVEYGATRLQDENADAFVPLDSSS